MSDRIVGGYRIVETIGAGGMGSVFLAEATDPVREVPAGTRVALKIIHGHLLDREGFLPRVEREAEAGMRVRHPNVVRTFAIGATGPAGATRHYLVLEYVKGVTIRKLIGDLGWAPPPLARHIGREVGKGLAAIHAAGMIHRDLKPENVLITDEDDVKIMDLGVALLKDEASRLSLTGQFVGTTRYAAPEQFQGKLANLDGRTDLYALGLLLFELTTGGHPFVHPDPRVQLRRQLTEDVMDPRKVKPDLPADLAGVILKLLERKPENRPADAEAVISLLGRL